MSQRTVLLTGAASGAGARILRILLDRTDVGRVYALDSEGEGAAARAGSGRPSDARAARGTELVPVEGDPLRPRLGIDDRTFDEIAQSVDVILHCAERRALDKDIAAARAHNVEPLRALVEMLEKAPEARLVHLSTTWVCGTKGGLFTEFDLACKQSFWNAYEQSKYEAECLLRGSSVSPRITIVRRSVAVDDASPDALPRAATTIDSMLSTMRSAKRMLVAGDPRARLDVVPVGYVAAGAVALADHSAALGRTVHLVAGWDGSWTLRSLLDLARARYGTGRVGFWPSLLSAGARFVSHLTLGRIAAIPGPLVPYFRQRSIFDDFLAKRLLSPLGIVCPPPDAFVGRVFDMFAKESTKADVTAATSAA